MSVRPVNERQVSTASSMMQSDYDSNFDDDDYEYESAGEEGLDHTAPISQIHGTKSVTVLTREELIVVLRQSLNSFHGLTHCDTGTAAKFLDQNHWLVSDASTAYFEYLNSHSVVDPPTHGDCMICGDENVPLKGNGCGHSFCTECWCGHLVSRIQGGSALLIPCMMHKCSQIVGIDFIESLMKDPKCARLASEQETFLRFLGNDFVVSHPCIRWCPNATGECGRASLVDSKDCAKVACTCGETYCFMCGLETHQPASCLDLKKWLAKEQDDGETANWIAGFTKDCPKCNSAIEKNGGCNHMTCRNCKGEFCWVCGKNWKTHKSCNKYEPENVSEARGEIMRYNHYWTRYNTHRQSQTLEHKLRQRVADKMVQMIEKGERDALNNAEGYDPSFMNTMSVCMEQATDSLIHCRRTLRFTYIYAYYLPKGSAELNLFEFLQEDLETSTEALSRVLESPLLTLLNQRDQLRELAHSAMARRKNLLEGSSGNAKLVQVTPSVPDVQPESDTDHEGGATTSSKKGGFKSLFSGLRKSTKG